jgi:glycosyltransferase involved in cell wall biosynthesis
MKVAQILYSGLGGHGSVAFSLAAADMSGEWIHSFGFVGIEPLLPAYRDKCLGEGWKFASFQAPPRRPWRMWKRIYRWLRDTRPDAVILHSPPSLLPTIAYALVSGVWPVVVEQQANSLRRFSDWLFSAAAMILAKHVVVLTPAYFGELRLGLAWWFRAAKVVTIPNGIDTGLFRPSALQLDARGEFALGMAARFVPAKRQDVLLSAIEKVVELRPGVAWRLDLAGDGENLPRIAAKVREMGLGKYVRLLGYLDEDALALWLRTLDIYLLASNGETLNTSLLQAMASQLPIVGSDVGGVRELIGADPACGLLVANQDPCGFARAVLELVDDRAKASALALAGRNRCLATFTNGTMRLAYRRLISGDKTSLENAPRSGDGA